MFYFPYLNSEVLSLTEQIFQPGKNIDLVCPLCLSHFCLVIEKEIYKVSPFKFTNCLENPQKKNVVSHLLQQRQKNLNPSIPTPYEDLTSNAENIETS